MDQTFNKVASDIDAAFAKIDAAVGLHRSQIKKLEEEYKQIGLAQGTSIDANKGGYQTDRQQAIAGEMRVRRQLIKEAEDAADELRKHEVILENVRKKTEESAKAYQTLQSRIRELKEEMARLVSQGIDQQSEAYKSLANELGQLKKVQTDIAQQGKILSSDQAGFQGVLQGLSGLAGGLSAAIGAVSLFAGENEDLQKVMTKVQSVIAITIGLEQVSQALNKNGAFILHTVRKVKELLTAAELKFATALGISNVAAQALMGTLTLGLSVAITGAIVLIDRIITKNREAKEAQEEFSNAVVEGAYKPIAKIEQLSQSYRALGDDMKAKEKFIKDNKKAFEELGVSIRSVSDAENLLINNKEAFISAQIAKAKAAVYFKEAEEEVKNLIKLERELEKLKPTKEQSIPRGMHMVTVTVVNPEYEKKKKEVEKANSKLRELFDLSAKEEKNAFIKLKNASIGAINDYDEGTVRAINQAIQSKEEELNNLIPQSDEWKQKLKEIEDLRKLIENPTKESAPKGNLKDPFIEKLKKRKEEYEHFNKAINSTNEGVRKEAVSKFSDLQALISVRAAM